MIEICLGRLKFKPLAAPPQGAASAKPANLLGSAEVELLPR
jgi:hypothetical protein